MADLHHDVKHMKNERDEKKVVIHRDIKSDNISLNPETHTVKYCDYGMAVTLPNNRRSNPDNPLKDPKPTMGSIEDTKTGTPLFMAPEIRFSKDKGVKYSEATEVYALGVTLAEIFGIARASYARYDFSSKPNDVPQNLHELILSMVDNNPPKKTIGSCCSAKNQYYLCRSW